MTLEELILETAEAIRPPERLTVPEAAEKYRYINNPGSYVGPYKVGKTPYMRTPSELFTSTRYTGLVFVGPSQSGKTDAFENWLIHSAMCDPNDMMLIEKSQSAARDFSIRRIQKLIRNNPEFAAKILPGKQNQNILDLRFKSGALLTLSWPSINELSGKPVPRLYLTDYDRMDDNIDGEGAPFDLARARSRTFKRFGMTVAESSPGTSLDNPRWLPQTPHEAPPVTGILSLYNRGDRRRWYWRCVSCGGDFEPAFSLLRPAPSKDIAEASEGVHLPCPHCGQIYYHDADEKHGIPGKRGLNANGVWLAEGQSRNEQGEIVGDAKRTDIASFWLKGVAAEFSDWPGLMRKYLEAQRELEMTGSEEALRTTVNTDQSEAYIPQSVQASLLPEDLMSRRRDYGERGTVPEGVRFLISTVDVQGQSFQCATWGVIAPDDLENGHPDFVMIDRWAVRKSDRLDDDGDVKPVSPHAHLEDWYVLLDAVIRRTYPLSDGSGRVMRVKLTGIDSGGRAGVATNALNFWRWLRDETDESQRCLLVRGIPRRTEPRVQVTYPDSHKKDRHSGARGDVPTLNIASVTMKDTAANFLQRDEPGGGMFTFPLWAEDWVFNELTVEVRSDKGWENPKNLRNETFDLIHYFLSLAISPSVRYELIDWSDPPAWALPWGENVMVGNDFRFESQAKVEYDFRNIGAKHA